MLQLALVSAASISFLKLVGGRTAAFFTVTPRAGLFAGDLHQNLGLSVGCRAYESPLDGSPWRGPSKRIPPLGSGRELRRWRKCR